MSRNSNFLFQDCELLTNIVNKHKDIVECKITNAFHNNLKEQAWIKITKEFNSACVGPKRVVKQIRNKYKHMKRFNVKNNTAVQVEVCEETDETSNQELTPVIQYVRSINGLPPPTSPDENYHIIDVAVTDLKDSNYLEDGNENRDITVESLGDHSNEMQEKSELECDTLHDSTQSELKQSLHSCRIKRKFNVLTEPSEVVEKKTKARKSCLEEQESDQLRRHRAEEHSQLLRFREEEHAQLLEFRKKEHAQLFEIKEKEHTLREEEHALQMKILSEKLFYFQKLNRNVSFGDRDLL